MKDFFESLSIDLHEDGEAYLFFYVSKGDILYQLTCKGKTTDLTPEPARESCDICQRSTLKDALFWGSTLGKNNGKKRECPPFWNDYMY